VQITDDIARNTQDQLPLNPLNKASWPAVFIIGICRSTTI